MLGLIVFHHQHIEILFRFSTAGFPVGPVGGEFRHRLIQQPFWTSSKFAWSKLSLGWFAGTTRGNPGFPLAIRKGVSCDCLWSSNLILVRSGFIVSLCSFCTSQISELWLIHPDQWEKDSTKCLRRKKVATWGISGAPLLDLALDHMEIS